MIRRYMRFFIALICVMAWLTQVPNRSTQSKMPAIVAGSNNIQDAPLEELKNENKQLEQQRRVIQHKEDNWNKTYLCLAAAAILIGACSWFSQNRAATLASERLPVEENIAANNAVIHYLEMEAEAAARREIAKKAFNRTLSPAQAATIVKTLLAYPQRRVQVSCPENDLEAFEYAKQLSRALESAHWDTGPGTLRRVENFEFGVSILVREDEAQAGRNLAEALKRAGIKSEIHPTKLALLGIMQLNIGPKG